MVATMYGPRSIPGPPLRKLAGYRTFLRSFDRDPLSYIDSVFQKYGPVSALTSDSARLVFGLGPACNQELANTSDIFCSPSIARSSFVAVGSTVRKLAHTANHVGESATICSNWQQLHANPTFTTWYGSTVAATTQRMVERWGLGQQVDLVYVTRRLTLTTLFKTLLAIDPDASPESQTLLQDWLERTYHGYHTRLPHVARLAIRRSQQMIARLEALHRVQGEQGVTDVPAELQALVCRCGRHGSDSSCVAQIVPILDVATTLITSVLTWTIFLLSQHQRVLDDIRQELQHELPDELPVANRVQAIQDGLPLLERVVKETLRLLPPHALGLRYTAKRAELLGYELPAGATVVYSPYLTHRLATLFIAPQRFRPERWLYIEPTAAEYLPLGFVDESILPLSLLLKHVKLVLATLLQQTQLGLAAGVQVDVHLEPTLLPKTDLPMVVTPMNRPLIQREVHGNIRKLVEFSPHH